MNLVHSAAGLEGQPPVSHRAAWPDVRWELRSFCAAVGLFLIIPLAGGSLTAFGGIEGLALFHGDDRAIVLSPALRNSVRAVFFMFFAWAPLLTWTLLALPERAGAFRIGIGCAFVVGFVRLTGWLVDGYPGALPLLFMALELAVMPLFLLWHARLVRLSRPER